MVRSSPIDSVPEFPLTQVERILLSVKRNNAVFLLETPDGEHHIEKDFSPYRTHTKEYRTYFPNYLHYMPFMGESYPYPVNDQGHSIHKEATILTASAELGENHFAPTLEGRITEAGQPVSLVMENLGETYDNSTPTEELIRKLVALHSVYGNNFRELYEKVNWGRRDTKGLKPRDFGEELSRWQHYLSTVIYYCSSDFIEKNPQHKYVKIKRVARRIKSNKSTDLRRKSRRAVEKFLSGRSIDLERFVHQFLSADWFLTYGQSIHSQYAKRDIKFPSDPNDPDHDLQKDLKTLYRLYQQGQLAIVHGDFYPQNVFQTEEGVKVCDFREMRVANRHLDLVTTLYRHPRPQTSLEEIKAMEHVMDYVIGVRENEGIDLNFEEFYIGCQQTRLKNLIRIFALDSKFNSYEIRKYTKGISDFDDTPEDRLRATFIQRFVEDFQRLAVNMYIMKDQLSEFPNSDLFFSQVKSVGNFFMDLGIIPRTEKREMEELFAETYPQIKKQLERP